MRRFVSSLRQARLGSTFNQYAGWDPCLDAGPGTPLRRCRNLASYLESRRDALLMLVGEAPSYQGARFSGVPFTSERMLAAEHRTSLRPEGWAEPSATMVHAVLADLGLEERIVLWNAVPFHPHQPGKPLSNRRPTRAEIEQGRAFVESLRVALGIERLVAVGRVAESILPGAAYVRHPANAGKAEFRAGLSALLGGTRGPTSRIVSS